MDGKDIKKVLDSFASHASVHDTVIKQSKENIQYVVDKVSREEASDIFDNDLEKLNGYNLLSFLYFVLDTREKAVKYNDLALEVNDKNINALACRTFYHLQWKEFYKSSQICKRLKHLKNGNELEKLSAKAEVAYLFSKLGMEFYSEAEKRFENVLIENIAEDIPQLNICSWRFSLAQTIRRQINMHNAPTPLQHEQAKALFQRVIDLFTKITKCSGEGVDRYKAKAYAELGIVLYRNRVYNMNSIYSYEECMHHALKLWPDDVSVLERCGTYFRLTKRIADAIKCFERAIEKKESSLSYHHIALCYKIMAVNEYKTTANSTGNTISCEDNSNTNSIASTKPVDSQDGRNGSTAVKGSEDGFRTGDLGLWTEDSDRKNEPMTPEEQFHLKILKCPKKLPFIPKSKTEKIFELLDKAINISYDTNTAALYDKGLVSRASNQPKKAIGIFRLMFRNSSTSDIQLTNSYEQAAICLLEMAENDPSIKEECEFDAKQYLKKAMEMSCNMVRKIPDLRRCWYSSPTLKMILHGQASTKETYTELAKFYKLLNDYSAAISFFDKVFDLEKDEEEQQLILLEIIQARLNVGDINEAYLAVELILNTPNCSAIIKENLNLVMRVCIASGVDTWKCDERNIARQRFRTALQCSRGYEEESNGTEFDNKFDLFVLSSSTSEDKATQLCNILKGFGLKITSRDDILPGLLIRKEIMDKIDNSKCIVVYLSVEDNQEELNELETYTDIIDRRFKVISDGGRAERDRLYSSYPLVKLNCEMVDENGELTNAFRSWIKDSFIQIFVD